MSVPKSKRSKSGEEFEHVARKVYNDACNNLEQHFGAGEPQRSEKADYIRTQGVEAVRLSMRLLYHIKVAKALHPTSKKELKERRVNQDKAIGICLTLLTLYELTYHRLGVNEEKHVEELKHLRREIQCIRDWRTRDNKSASENGNS